MSKDGQGWFLVERIFFYFAMFFMTALILFAVWFAFINMRGQDQKEVNNRMDVLIDGGGQIKDLPNFIEGDEKNGVGEDEKMPEIKYDGEKELPEFLKIENDINDNTNEDVK